MTDCIASDIRTSARVVRDLAGFQQLRKAWNELNTTGRYRAPFYSWTWYDAWWRNFGAEGQLFIIVAEDTAGTIHGIAPLMKTRTRIRGLPVREIRFIENAIAPRNSLLLREGVPEQAAIEAILACLSDRRREWDIATLANMDEQASFLGHLRNSIQRLGLHGYETAGRRSPCVSITGDFGAYFASRFKSKHRYNIKRGVRQLLARSDYRLLHFTEPGSIAEGLKLAFRVSEASWKGRIGAHMTETGARRRFYEQITRELAQVGQVRIWIAMLGDMPIAVEYQLTDGDTAYLLVSDFVQSCDALSPGTSLLYQVLERLHDEPLSCLDFSGEAYDYKMRWATGMRSHVDVEIFSHRPYSRFLFLTKSTFLPALRWTRDRVLRRYAKGVDAG